MEQPRLVPIKLDNYKPLREMVFESLREAIILGRLKPGERLMEIQLAEEMGVSRTPVRRPSANELEGFVVMVPREPMAGISVKDIVDVLKSGRPWGLAAALAAERITSEEMDQLEMSLLRINANAEEDRRYRRGFRLPQSDYQASATSGWFKSLPLQEQIHRFRMTSLAQPGRTKLPWKSTKKL